MTPEILIVGDPAGRRQLADLIAGSGYGVVLCSPRELNRRVRVSSPPVAIVACIGDLDADVLLAGLRRTRAGASIPVILYGRLGGNLRDLADVLDIGADHFVEEPASEEELRDALSQFVRPPTRDRGRAPARGGDDRDRDRDRDRDERPRGAALGELHRTLDRLQASLHPDDSRSDPELSEMGLDRIPDVDPPSDAMLDSDPLVGDSREHTRARSHGREPVRGDGLTVAADLVDDGPSRETYGRGRAAERPRPATRRDSTDQLNQVNQADRVSRDRRPVEPDHDTGPIRRSWRDEPSSSADPRAESAPALSGRDVSSGSETQRTRAWDRPDHEGPIRRGRERPDSPRSSAVLLGRRPDRDFVRPEPARPEPARPEREPSENSARLDPHGRDSPWPEDDFDPSESTMIRRERSSATTRRRSSESWTGREAGDTRDAGRSSERAPDPGRPTSRLGRPPPRSELPDRGAAPGSGPRRAREPVSREPEPSRASEPEREFESESEREPKSSPARARPSRRPSAPARPPTTPSLHIDPSLRESGKLGADIDVPAVLWTLHEQRFTGQLRLNRARVEKQFWLHDGEAVFARSTATSDRLVDGLLRRGVLTRPQYETARRLAAKEPRRAGQLLVDAGFLKARELDVQLRDHLARVIDATFVWSDGTWSTEPGDRTDEPIQLEVPMAALILDGVRYRCDASDLEDRLTRRVGGRGPLVPRLRVDGEALGADRQAGIDARVDELVEELGESFRLLPEEESWLRRFDGRHGVAALLADGADEQALFALLFTLDLAGYVDLREQPEPQAQSDREPAQVDSDRILERLRLAREADYFDLLGIGRDASRSEVRQAHVELSATFSDDALEQDSCRRHGRELRELRAAIEEARDILADDAMRSAYLAHLGEGA